MDFSHLRSQSVNENTLWTCRPSLDDLPPPPPGKTGWPWTETSSPLPEVRPNGSPWPKVSIVTPSYNQGQFIEETIRSVLLQGYPNLEYIIIDGGSTDESTLIIQKYAPWLSYWVSEQDHGQSHAINKGFRRCSGELVAWQNSDDYYLPGALHALARAHCLRADVYFGHIHLVDQTGALIRSQCYTPYSLRANRYEGIVMASQATFWRRDLFERVGYLDESLHYTMDREFFLRLGLKGCHFSLVNRFLACSRRHAAAKTTGQVALWPAERQRIDERYGIKRPAQRLMLALLLLRRAGYYVLQGHYRYAFKGLRRRLHLGHPAR
jgi:glycosyltransferase involved in cell wall biosynthesis